MNVLKGLMIITTKINWKDYNMKATEFRLGNYLQDRNGKLCEVTELVREYCNDDSFQAVRINHPSTSLPVRGILLTGEWLLRLGFEYKPLLKLYAHKDHPNFIIMTGDITFSLFINVKSIRIRYVHELQNMFYSLIGTELFV